MSILSTNSISPNQRKPFNLQSSLLSPTSTPINKSKSILQDHHHPRSVHFDHQTNHHLSPSQIPPRRLFNSDRSQQQQQQQQSQKDLNHSASSDQNPYSFSIENLKYPNSTTSQSDTFLNLNHFSTHSSSSPHHHSTSNLYSTPKKSTPDWLQELVDQPKPPKLDSSTHKLLGHFPSTTSHSTLSKSQAFSSPLHQSSLPQTSSPNLSKSIHQSSVSQNTPNPKINSKVPISLNPNLTAGVKLGQLRLSQRLRVNLISFIFLLIFTSTKSFDKLLNTIDHRFPSLSTPVLVLEWLLLLLLFGNVLEAYYKLKTRAPITHVEIPLTPQQIRGNLSTPQSLRTSSPNLNNRTSTDPKSSLISLHRSNQRSPTKRVLPIQPEPSSNKKAWSSSILTHDPLANPFSQSTNQIFKRQTLEPNHHHHLSSSLNPSHQHQQSLHSSNLRRPTELQLSQSVRKVSNPNTLHCLLEETLG